MATRPVTAFFLCCESMEFALKHGFLILDTVYSELAFPPITIKELGGSVGNVLTGETYDPEQHSVGLTPTFCPFCGLKLVTYEFEEE